MVMMMMKIFLQFLLSSTQLTAASRRLAGEKTAVLGRTKNFERCNQMMWVWHLRKMSLMQQCCVPNGEKITSLCIFFIVFTQNNFDLHKTSSFLLFSTIMKKDRRRGILIWRKNVISSRNCFEQHHSGHTEKRSLNLGLPHKAVAGL